MNSQEYIEQLQQCATEEGLTRLRTLLLEFAATLSRLSCLKAELEAMTVEQPGIDYDRLADKLEGLLEHAADLLAKIETMPAEEKNEPEMQELLHGIANTMTLRTISVWEGELESRTIAMKQRRMAVQRAIEEQLLLGEEVRQKKEHSAKLEHWLNFVAVAGGTFEMGGTFVGSCDDEKPVHEVELDSFFLCKYPVTQGLWQVVMGDNPSYFSYLRNSENYPVESVSWEDTQIFLDKLNELTGKTYRLPTEAEWEYAARSGGKNEAWAGTDCDAELGHYAWYDENSDHQTHPVGSKRPNALGLYDMSGNVWEWCADWYDVDYYSHSSGSNPPGQGTGTERVIRGGSWRSGDWSARAAYRGSSVPGNRGTCITSFGFRLALSS